MGESRDPQAARPIAAVASPFNDLNEAWSFWAGVRIFPLPKGVTSYPALPNWTSLCMIIALGSYELQYGMNGLMKSAIRPEYGLADEAIYPAT